MYLIIIYNYGAYLQASYALTLNKPKAFWAAKNRAFIFIISWVINNIHLALGKQTLFDSLWADRANLLR